MRPCASVAGHALHAVHAALVADLAEHGLAGDLEDDFPQAAQLGGVALHLLHLQAVRLGVAVVHAVEIGGEKRRLVAAGAGADFHDGVAVLVFIRRQERDLDLFLRAGDALLQRRDFRRGHLGQLGIGAPGQLLVFAQLHLRLAIAFPQVEQFLGAGVLPHHVAGLFRVGVEIRRGNGRFEFAEAVGLFFDERVRNPWVAEREAGRGKEKR